MADAPDLPDFVKRARRAALLRARGFAPAAGPGATGEDQFDTRVARPAVVTLKTPDETLSPPLWSQPQAVASEQDREAVLTVAARLFSNTANLRKVTLEDVRTLAGVSPPAMRAIAATREALLEQVVAREVDLYLQTGASWLDPNVDVRDLLRAFSERSFGYVLARPLLLQLLLGVLAELSPKLAERFSDLRFLCTSLLTKVLDVGIAQGKFRADLHREATASLLFEIHLAGLVVPHGTGRDPALGAAARRDAALKLLFRGLHA